MSEKDAFGLTEEDVLQEVMGFERPSVPVPTEERGKITERTQRWVIKDGTPQKVHLFFYPEEFDFDPVYYETDENGKFLINPDLQLPNGQIVNVGGHSPVEIGIAYQAKDVYETSKELIATEIEKREQEAEELRESLAIVLEEIDDLKSYGQ